MQQSMPSYLIPMNPVMANIQQMPLLAGGAQNVRMPPLQAYPLQVPVPSAGGPLGQFFFQPRPQMSWDRASLMAMCPRYSQMPLPMMPGWPAFSMSFGRFVPPGMIQMPGQLRPTPQMTIQPATSPQPQPAQALAEQKKEIIDKLNAMSGQALEEMNRSPEGRSRLLEMHLMMKKYQALGGNPLTDFASQQVDHHKVLEIACLCGDPERLESMIADLDRHGIKVTEDELVHYRALAQAEKAKHVPVPDEAELSREELKEEIVEMLNTMGEVEGPIGEEDQTALLELMTQYIELGGEPFNDFADQISRDEILTMAFRHCDSDSLKLMEAHLRELGKELKPKERQHYLDKALTDKLEIIKPRPKKPQPAKDSATDKTVRERLPEHIRLLLDNNPSDERSQKGRVAIINTILLAGIDPLEPIAIDQNRKVSVLEAVSRSHDLTSLDTVLSHLAMFPEPRSIFAVEDVRKGVEKIRPRDQRGVPITHDQFDKTLWQLEQFKDRCVLDAFSTLIENSTGDSDEDDDAIHSLLDLYQDTYPDFDFKVAGQQYSGSGDQSLCLTFMDKAITDRNSQLINRIYAIYLARGHDLPGDFISRIKQSVDPQSVSETIDLWEERVALTERLREPLINDGDDSAVEELLSEGASLFLQNEAVFNGSEPDTMMLLCQHATSDVFEAVINHIKGNGLEYKLTDRYCQEMVNFLDDKIAEEKPDGLEDDLDEDDSTTPEYKRLNNIRSEIKNYQFYLEQQELLKRCKDPSVVVDCDQVDKLMRNQFIWSDEGDDTEDENYFWQACLSGHHYAVKAMCEEILTNVEDYREATDISVRKLNGLVAEINERNPENKTAILEAIQRLLDKFSQWPEPTVRYEDNEADSLLSTDSGREDGERLIDFEDDDD